MAYIVFSNSETNSNLVFDIQENSKPYLVYWRSCNANSVQMSWENGLFK